MAEPQYSVTQLIANIKRRCAVPTSQLTYQPADFALMANDTLQGEVVPLVMSARQEYFVEFIDVINPADGIIDIPDVAVGAKLRAVCWLQVPNGNPLQMTSLPRLDLDVVAGFGFANSTPYTIAGFYVQDNQICIYPNTGIPAGQTIRLYYYRRSLVLAAPSTFSRVVSVDEMANEVVLERVPVDFLVGTQINTLSPLPNFKVTKSLATITAISSPTIVLDSVEGISVGDYMSEFGFSAIPQVPVEAHAYLAQLTAKMALEGLGAVNAAQAAGAKAEILKTGILIMFSERVDGSIKKLVHPKGGIRAASGLGGTGYGGWGRY